MKINQRFGFLLSAEEKEILNLLSEIEGGMSKAALLRRLIRLTAIENGIWDGPEYRSKKVSQTLISNGDKQI